MPAVIPTFTILSFARSVIAGSNQSADNLTVSTAKTDLRNRVNAPAFKLPPDLALIEKLILIDYFRVFPSFPP
jgi:hypothetical protein